MVKKGSQTRNNKAVREMVSNKRVLADGQYVITDALNNIIIVDTVEGTVYKYVGDDIIECNTADTSKKQNGYLYVDIAIMADNKITVINYAQHSLIAMLAHTSDYDNLVEEGKTPIVNHKNNCPWNNNSRNLEWTTQKWNVLHGKVIHSIYHSDYSDILTEVRHNRSEVDFICLKAILSVKLIERYEEHIKAQGLYKSLKQFWGLKDNTDIIGNANIICFLDWLDEQV